MTLQEITNFLDKKIDKNEKEVIISFYEVRMKMNLSKQDTDTFLSYCKTRLENFGYKVYFTGDEFIQNGNMRVVQSNELMIAIK
ncbi:MAG: hypothetical protein V8R82_06550 [Clostridia bacterium]